jgi:SAM-dependent methyltransferase
MLPEDAAQSIGGRIRTAISPAGFLQAPAARNVFSFLPRPSGRSVSNCDNLPMATQTWDPTTYAKNARFVSDLGSPVLELLAPQPGERILDLGCGDGVLTRKIAGRAGDVVGVDSSAPQVEAARKLGLDARVMNVEDLPFQEEFDAVFSNAVLHWIRRADAVIDGVYRSLRPGGRFVAESVRRWKTFWR